MKRLNRWGSVLLLALVAIETSTAREIIYTNQNCAITYPDGWRHVQITQSNYIALVKDISDLKTIIVQVREADPRRWPNVNDEFKEASRGAIRKEGVLTGERNVVIDGIPGWEYDQQLRFEGRDVTSVSRIIIADGKAYKINTMYMEGNAATETNLQTSLRSFRFLTSPSPPPAEEHLPAWVFLVLFTVCGAFVTRWAIHKVRHVKTPSVSD